MLGLAFDSCHPFNLELSFDHCILNMSSFYNLNLSKTPFISCHLEEVDFAGCNLSGAKIKQCQLAGAIFSKSNLNKADLRHSSNYTIDPDDTKIKGAHFSLPEVLTLLASYNIKID